MSLEKIFELLESGESYRSYSRLKGTVTDTNCNYLHYITDYRMPGISFRIVSQFLYDAQKVDFTFKHHSLWYKGRRHENTEWYDRITPYIYLESKIDNVLFMVYMRVVNDFTQFLEQAENKHCQWMNDGNLLISKNSTNYTLSPIGFRNKDGEFLYETFMTYNFQQNLLPEEVSILCDTYDYLYEITTASEKDFYCPMLLTHEQTPQKGLPEIVDKNDFDDESKFYLFGTPIPEKPSKPRISKAERLFPQLFEYEIVDQECHITKYLGHSNYERVTIPDSYQGFPITELCENLFLEDDEIESLTINAPIKHLPAFCLCDCGFLRYLHLPNTLLTIGKHALSNIFYWKPSHLPEAIQDIDELAFSGTSFARNFTLPPNVTIIKKRTFYYCEFEKIILGDDVISIEEEAFRDCKYLTDIILSRRIMYIADSAFDGIPKKKLTIHYHKGTILPDICYKGYKLRQIKEKHNVSPMLLSQPIKTVLLLPKKSLKWKKNKLQYKRKRSK